MSVDLILTLIILFFVLYSYTTTRNQFAATASALRQIWSGGCPLACQQSEYSAVSGSSNPESQTAECRTTPLQTPHTPSPSRGCSCVNCPCALIENFISSCRPATTMYTQFVDCTTTCVDYFIQMVLGMYEFTSRVLNCQCQPAEITDECEEISAAQGCANKSKQFAETTGKHKVDNDDERNTVIEADDFKPQIESSTTDRDRRERKGSKSGASPISKEKTKKHLTDHEIAFGESDKRSSPENEEKEATSSSESKGICAKCIEKGRNCVQHCPKANKKK